MIYYFFWHNNKSSTIPKNYSHNPIHPPNILTTPVSFNLASRRLFLFQFLFFHIALFLCIYPSMETDELLNIQRKCMIMKIYLITGNIYITKKKTIKKHFGKINHSTNKMNVGIRRCSISYFYNKILRIHSNNKQYETLVM